MQLDNEYHIIEKDDSMNYFLNLGIDCVIYRADWFLDALRGCILPFGAWRSSMFMPEHIFNQKLHEIHDFDDFKRSICKYMPNPKCVTAINLITAVNPLRGWFIAEKVVNDACVYLVCVAMFNGSNGTRIFKPSYAISTINGYVFSKTDRYPEECDYNYLGVDFYCLKPFFEESIINKTIKNKLYDVLVHNHSDTPRIENSRFWSDAFKSIMIEEHEIKKSFFSHHPTF